MTSTNIWSNKRLRQLLLLTAGSMVILWILIAFLFYNFTIKQHEQSTLMRLAGIANSLALQIDGTEHEQLFIKYKNKDDIKSSAQDASYYQIHRLLKSNFDANMLKSPIYTIAMDEIGKLYEFGITSDSIPYYRHAYNTYHSTLSNNFGSGGMIPSYTDEYGMWLSAFAPIKNKDKKVVAIVMADEKLDIFMQSVYAQLWLSFIWSLILFLIVMLLLIWQMRKILNREQQDKFIIEASNLTISKVNAELNFANEKLNDQDTFRKEMISNISHDFRTPLVSMMGFIDLLRSKNKELTEQEKSNYINVVFAETNRLNQLVGDLFELSKLDSGHIKINPEPFNIYELVSDILQKYQLKIKEKEVSLNFEINENLGLAYGDIKYIDRLFQNLLDNAVRYVNHAGYIKISILDDKDYFKIKVCNSGSLIPKEKLETIFDRYYTSEKSDHSRSGLGLAIAKSICMLHGTNIAAESNDQVNSFWFTVKKV